jgi:hypothetical protein
MRTVTLTKSANFPADLKPGDYLHVMIADGEPEQVYEIAKPAFEIWVQPVKGGYLVRNASSKTIPGPMFYVCNDNPMEYIAAITALMADDRL